MSGELVTLAILGAFILICIFVISAQKRSMRNAWSRSNARYDALVRNAQQPGGNWLVVFYLWLALISALVGSIVLVAMK